MKKNDFATFIVYVGMMAIALLVGLLVLRPVIESDSWKSSAKILIVLGCIGAGVLINSLLLEVGHLLGAKMGHYKVYSWIVLGVGFRRTKEGKMKAAISGFNGLTGETKIVPNDPEKSTTSGMTLIPLVLYLVEVIVGVVLIGISDRRLNVNADYSAPWLKVFAITMMSVGGIIYLYNFFPANLDVITDGYRMILLSKPINREAYNRHLINEYNGVMGIPLKDFPVYDDVTDYTAAVNMDKVYSELAKGGYGQAILIVQKTLETEERISEATKNEAMAMKLSIVLLTTKREAGLTYYDNIENEDRKYLATLPDGPALRAYLLVAGVLEGSEAETNYALAKAARIMRKTPEARKEVELKLLGYTIQRIKTLHPNWNLVNWENPKAKAE